MVRQLVATETVSVSLTSVAYTAVATSVTDAPSASASIPVTCADFDVSQPVANVLQYTAGYILSKVKWSLVVSALMPFTLHRRTLCDEQLLLHFKALSK